MIFSNDSFFRRQKAMPGTEHDVLHCVEKFYISNLGSTGMSASRDVDFGMTMLLY